MAVTQTLIKSRASNDASTASILTHVNDELSENNETCMFVTVFIGILNVKTGLIMYTNAGHNPPYIKRGSTTAERLPKRHGPILGARPGITYGEDETMLSPGDTLVLYTDGVTEALNPNEELFSEDRLASLLSAAPLASAEEALRTTVGAVRDFEAEAEQADDITVMALQFHGGAPTAEAAAFDISVPNRLTEIDRVNELFNTFARTNGVPEADRKRFNMVIDELLNNTISHAYQDDAVHEIDIHVERSGNRVCMTISDDGIPFNPFAREAPRTDQSILDRPLGGMGIHLVRQIMDDTSYQRRIGRNVITVVSEIDPNADAGDQAAGSQ
jgi:sigma-B regulation protein RsbU (phosphoserine phosphatase)